MRGQAVHFHSNIKCPATVRKKHFMAGMLIRGEHARPSSPEPLISIWLWSPQEILALEPSESHESSAIPCGHHSGYPLLLSCCSPFNRGHSRTWSDDHCAGFRIWHQSGLQRPSIFGCPCELMTTNIVGREGRPR